MRNFFISQKEVDFIGRDALLRQREQGVQRKYVQLLLNDHDLEFDAWPWGGEPIYRNGKYCGMTTTTGYGFTFKKQVAKASSLLNTFFHIKKFGASSKLFCLFRKKKKI